MKENVNRSDQYIAELITQHV